MRLILLALSEVDRHLVADLALAGHLGAVLSGEGDPQLTAERNDLPGLHEQPGRADVAGDPPGHPIIGGHVDREDLVEAKVGAAISQGGGLRGTGCTPMSYLVARCRQIITPSHLLHGFGILRSRAKLGLLGRSATDPTLNEDLHTVHLSRLLPVLLLLPLSAWAQSADFDALKSKSEPLGGLGPFLERYVGRCEDPETQKTCEANAATFRRQANGKRYAMLVDDVRSLLQAEAYDPDSGDLTLQLTPIFGAYGYALTTGRPKRLNAQGLPTMRLVKLEG